MSLKYIKDITEQWATNLVTPFYPTLNDEQNPDDDIWCTLVYYSEYVEPPTFEGCAYMEEGTVDLEFYTLSGRGGDDLVQIEKDAKDFYKNKDPAFRFNLVNRHGLEAIDNTGEKFRLVAGFDYAYTDD